MVLGYWKIRGLAQPLRYLLEYCGFDYEEVRYELNKEGREKWNEEDKKNLGLSFPNLPYLIDGEIKITQSKAILRHIAEKKGGDMVGDDLQTKTTLSMLVEVTVDFNNSIVRLCYGKNFEERLPEWVKEQQIPFHQQFSEFLGDKAWAIGHITFVDFFIYEMLDQSHLLNPNGFEHFPSLTSYIKRFKEIPAIANYRSSPRFIDRPINGPSASFK